jgi:hypothetical protein
MSTATQIREALKATLDANLPTLTTYAKVSSVQVLPAVIVQPDTADFVTFGRGTDQWNFKLIVLCAQADDAIGQDSLDAIVTSQGAGSIRQVIFQNPTLGLADVNAAVTGLTDYGGQYDSVGIQHVGAILHLQVLTSGTA